MSGGATDPQAGFEALVAALEGIAASAQALGRLHAAFYARDVPFEAAHLFEEWLRIDAEHDAAGGAADIVLRLQLTQRFRDLVAAAQAADLNLRLVERELHHLTSPVGVDDPREARPAESRESGPGGAEPGEGQP